jgi:PAS domain S-box-containing protein
MFEQELSRYWETVVNTLKDGVMVVDKGGTIVSVNRALEDLTGYSNEELIGNNCSVLNCDICEIARDRQGDHWCVLFRTGHINMKRCVLMRKDGSYMHVLKNASLLRDTAGRVMGAVETVTDLTEIVERDNQIEAFRRELRSEDGFHGILGTTASMQRVFDLIANAKNSDAPVIIFGESGTGKELVARAIHETGVRKKKPFVKVNCAALNESLLESELFGHVKGAFTGAYRTREGRFEAAQDGDIFLDEIGDLPLSTQVKLLRVLEERVIERVGDNKPIAVNVRIISATNKNLRELVDRGAFRQDLFYRINVIPITVPPLRERIGDIPLLSEAFFRRIRLKSAKNIQSISNDALKVLMNYHWPGNARELKSAFEYAFVTCQESIIRPHHLPPNIFHKARGLGESGRRSADGQDSKRKALIEALLQAGGNQSEAARILGVSRVTVWNRIKKYRIDLKRTVHT